MKIGIPLIAAAAVSTLVFVAQSNGAVSKIRNRQAATHPPLQFQHLPRPERFRPRGTVPDEDRAAIDDIAAASSALRGSSQSIFTEAPKGFDNLTNGFSEQGPPFDSLNEDNVVALRSFNDNRFIFEEVETVADGLGPTYNAQSCRECHQNVVTGGASQVAEHRIGPHQERRQFFESLGGSLIAVARDAPGHRRARRLRATTSAPSAFRPTRSAHGFVEAIANTTLLAIRDSQPAAMRGTAVRVPVLEANSAPRIGRFGWKSQHASLESFAADAYLNEMGITSTALPGGEHIERTATSASVRTTTPCPIPRTMASTSRRSLTSCGRRRRRRAARSPPTSAPARRVFAQIGCATCHVSTIRTATPGHAHQRRRLTVPAALGNKIIHPYSDFLLHDIGTGDGIPIQPTAEFAATANQIRTAPLWALRTRNRLMHDGLSSTKEDAIARHGGQASGVRARYSGLSSAERRQLLAFLDSL